MDIMSLIWFVAILCIIGVVLWGGAKLIAKVPMPDFVRINHHGGRGDLLHPARRELLPGRSDPERARAAAEVGASV